MPNYANLNSRLRFAPIAPAPRGGQRGGSTPKTSPETLRYYQERVPLLKNMNEVIGTTSAPSDQHQFAGTTPDGHAIWKKVAPAPAPSGGGGGGGGGGGNAAAQQLAQLTAQSEAYRKEATAALEAGKLRIQQLEDEDLQRQKAAELQNRLAIQAQASQARGAAQANLKIAPASQTAQTAGTQGFVRRSNQFGITRRSTSTGPVNPYEQVNV
jgi:hypothetical protein